MDKKLEYQNRPRYTWDEAVKEANSEGRWHIRHVIDNGDGTFSVMSHINCEFCDYCEQANEYPGKNLPGPWAASGPFVAKENPYELRDQVR